MRGWRLWACVASVVPVCANAQVNATAILDRIRVSGQRAIDFHAVALPDTVYVGQQATYQVAVMLSQDAKSRLRRNPEFLPPELRGLLAYELGSPVRVNWRNFGETEYESHIFQRALFPVAAGAQIVPAPQLSYALPQSSSYFSREERFVVKAESASFVVRPLPVAERPDDFNGAVGVFRTTIRIDSTVARVGDPVVLTMRVVGTGNVKLLPRPVIELDWASVVAGTERVQVDSSGPLVKGTKEFDWILTPTRDGRVILPSFRYSYFDPYQAKYVVATTTGSELTVRQGDLATFEEEDGSSPPVLRPTAAPQTRTWWFGDAQPSALGWLALLLVAVAPIPALMLALRNRRYAHSSDLATGTEKYLVPVAVPDDTDPRGLARTSRRRLLNALTIRFEQDPHALVSRRQVVRALRRGGVSRATTRAVMTVLQQLDEVGFGEDVVASARSAGVDASPPAIDGLLLQIEAEAMTQGRHIRARSVVHLVMLGTAMLWGTATTPVLAQSQSVGAPVSAVESGQTMDTGNAPSAQVLLQLAQDAYQRRAYTEAAQRYAALAAAYPRDPDVLANWGASAWAVGDTVHAVVAWQRAARSEPFALDLQERVSLLPAGARGGIANIPMVPVATLSVLALVGWLVGWIAFAVRPVVNARWHARIPRIATVTLMTSVASAAMAMWGIAALDTSDLSVVTRPETMRVAPGNDADAMGGVTTGDVVQVKDVQETWQRVVHADGRRGWLPRARLIALDDSPQPH